MNDIDQRIAALSESEKEDLIGILVQLINEGDWRACKETVENWGLEIVEGMRTCANGHSFDIDDAESFIPDGEPGGRVCPTCGILTV